MVAAAPISRLRRYGSFRKEGVHVDDRLGLKPGKKFFEWARGTAMGKLRTGGDKFKVSLGESAAAEVQEALQGMKKELQSRSEELKQRLTFRIESRADFDARLKEKTTGMLLVPWGGDDDDEDRLQEETGVTLRCYPMQQDELPPDQVCPLTGKPSRIWAIFALAY
ncbi:Proline--tRNA ligase [Symbiodinium microadriaticum]|uniref:Proline--tRNA ligase n=1 Tax=Symbiodinium microadriaticum TaxID=2951 RepID=A0A1Q9F543_SYMMI|nr:Proline--tRNA ligase [Symbiodinium microadriaticum]